MRDSLKEYIDYYTEGDRVVFTALFHSKRGFCCGNGCRHCPYTPKHIKYSTEMDLNALEQLKKRAEDLENNTTLSPEEKKAEAIKLFESLNEVLQEYIVDDKETE